MFVLTDKKSGGVYAVNNNDDVKTVHMFQQKEDAQRYMHLLEANDYSQQLDLMEIDVDAVAIAFLHQLLLYCRPCIAHPGITALAPGLAPLWRTKVFLHSGMHIPWCCHPCCCHF